MEESTRHKWVNFKILAFPIGSLNDFVFLQVTVICLLSVVVSIFAQNHVIQVGIPKENHLPIPHGKNETPPGNFTFKFNYTGLSAQTFRDNLYRKFLLVLLLF